MNGLVSVIIVIYNHKKYMEDCINSVLKQNYPHELIVVDNCSSDGSAQLVREKFPDIKLIESPENKGYGAGNNLGVRHASGEYITILNPDTIVEHDWLQELIIPLGNGKKITTSKIILYNDYIINGYGNINHFTGLSFTRGLGAKPNMYQKLECVGGFSGCCFAMRKKDFEELDGFDENFFTYHEDSDLSWRAHLKGFKIIAVPTSVVRHDYTMIRHDYTLKVSPEKIYHVEKGRYMILRKYLTWSDFLRLFPSLLIVEILTCGYAIKHGWKGLKYKLKAMEEGLTVKVNKIEGDKNNLFKFLSATIPIEQLTSNKVEKSINILANKVFEWNFKIIRRRYS